MSTHTRYKGFSLLELLAAISIFVILFSIAAPNLQTRIEKSKADAAIFSIHRILNYARSTAIISQKTVSICGSNNRTCEKKWNEHLIAFYDKNNNAIPEDEEIINIQTVNKGQSQIKTRLAFGKFILKINNEGQPNLVGSFIYCPSSRRPTQARRLTWNRIGRFYLGRDTDGDNVVEDTNGKAIKCSTQ